MEASQTLANSNELNIKESPLTTAYIAKVAFLQDQHK